MTTLTLRDYQNEAIDRVFEARDRGVKRQLGVAATGLGKTIVFSSLAEQVVAKNPGTRTLVVAHRDELINQAVDKIKQVWPEADIGVVKAQRNEIDHDVVVASIQTLGRASRLEKVPADHFNGGVFVIDEGHHAKADSYQRVTDYFGVGTEEGPFLLGVTATPDRGDGKGLDDIFDEIVFNYDMLWGIRSGYLSDIRGRRITIEGLDLRGVKIRQGDYDAGQAGRAMEDADAPELIADAIVEHAPDRKTIVFTPTVAVADQVAAELRERGIDAEMVSGNTPIDERRDMLRRFNTGEIKVLANCQVLTEGFDEPSVDCIVIARPTRSRALYTQCIGRGSRRHPDKTDCLVLDVVGASDEHSLITIPSLFGIEKKNEFDAEEKTVTEAVFEEEQEQVRLGRLKAAEVELFRKVIESPIAWVSLTTHNGQQGYLCGLGSRDDGNVIIEKVPVEVGAGDGGAVADGQRQLGGIPVADGVDLDDGPVVPQQLWRTYLQVEEDERISERVLINKVDLEVAQGVGEDYVRKNGAKHLTDRNAGWRKDGPTDKQLDAAAKWRMPVNPEWTKGELSDALSAHIARKTASTQKWKDAGGRPRRR